MKTEAEIGVMLSQAKGSLGPTEAGRRKEGFHPRASQGARPCQHLDLRLFDSGTMREYIFVFLSQKKKNFKD